MGITFHRHPWPYASAFSLIACYTRINVLGRKELLAQWLPSKSISRVEQRLDWETIPHIVGARMLCRSFDLAPEAVPLAFDRGAWWPTSLRSAAERTQSGLRFCPECISQGYHCGLFQLPWWRTCPIHSEVLLEHCPNCTAPVSASLALLRDGEPHRLFHCKRCGFDLADSAAIVAASRGSCPDILHQTVGAHFRWIHNIDDRYVVPPFFGPAYSTLGRADALAFLSIAQVPLPVELRSFAEVPTETQPFPLQLKVERGNFDNPAMASHLAGCLAAAVVGNGSIGPQKYSLTWDQAKWLLGVERRLQRSLGQPMPRAHWDWLHKGRARVPGDRPPNRPTTPASTRWEEGFLERGYRRRTGDMAVSSSVAGQSWLVVTDSELQRLTAVRILKGLATFLHSRELEIPTDHTLRRVVEWWYSHFLVLALIDGTIYATHANSYIDETSDDPYLNQCWPRIGLERHPPGHDWSIAATYQVEGKSEVLVAFIIPLQFGPLLEPERWRSRDVWLRRERFAQGLRAMVQATISANQ